MKLLVIRHGESEADILGVHEGRADYELTERGHRQAEAMSRYVGENYSVGKIYHSTLKRAVQTAGHLARATGAPLFPEEKLMEFNNGLIAGLERSVVREKYPEVAVPIHASVYEQESLLTFRHRAEFMLSRILTENDPESTVTVVSHGGMITQLYRAFLRLPVDAAVSFRTGDTGIHEWVVSGGSRCVVRANYLAYSD